MPPKKKSPGRPKVPEYKPRDGKPLNVWVDEELLVAFDESRNKIRRTKRAHLEFILEKFLEAEGLWPPKQDDPK